jgi:hypothetical protein
VSPFTNVAMTLVETGTVTEHCFTRQTSYLSLPVSADGGYPSHVHVMQDGRPSGTLTCVEHATAPPILSGPR